MSENNDTKGILVGLSLLRQPTKFKVVRGIIEKRPLPEISRVYGIHYNYVQRVINKLVKEGLAVKAKVLGKVVVLPTPALRLGFKIALYELYQRAKRGSDISSYGVTLEALAKMFAKQESTIAPEQPRAPRDI